MPSLSLPSPLGPLTLVEEDGFVVQVNWGARARGEATATLESAAAELRAYFASARDRFDVPVAPSGTDLEREVWAVMCRIPRGQLRTYGDVAKKLGVAAQEIGEACGRNPIPVIIPCHRIVAASGKLGGYSGKGSVATKRWLIGHEAKPLVPTEEPLDLAYDPVPRSGSRLRPLAPNETHDTTPSTQKGDQTCLTFS